MPENGTESPDFDRPKPISTTALCVRYYQDQERAIESLASKYGVSQAKVARYLVERGLRGLDVR